MGHWACQPFKFPITRSWLINYSIFARSVQTGRSTVRIASMRIDSNSPLLTLREKEEMRRIAERSSTGARHCRKGYQEAVDDTFGHCEGDGDADDARDTSNLEHRARFCEPRTMTRSWSCGRRWRHTGQATPASEPQHLVAGRLDFDFSRESL